ncbi:MAG: putative glycoside hydrolase [Longimicrobiales bacterium]
MARPTEVRGIYVNAQAAGSPSHLGALLALASTSSLNTFVIDVKERGEVSYSSRVPLVSAVAAGRDYIGDLPSVLRALRDQGIYPIARIVCFSDPILAEARPEWAIRTSSGGLWLDSESGRPWVDPYNAEVWAYNIDLAREALAMGFAELQWDYVRFPDVSDSVRAQMVFPAQAGRTSAEAIEQFVAASRSELAAFGAPITVDVFGRVITEPGDSGIGQDWDELSQVADVILPMVYPALYGPGSFGLPDPNAEPYLLVRAAADSAVARASRAGAVRATIRPWLQAFTQGSTPYGAQQLLDQIRAVEDAGLAEWLFWNPGSVYPTGWP